MKQMIELTQKYKLDFEAQQPIVLGEIEDKFNCLQELIKLRFEKSDEMAPGDNEECLHSRGDIF